MQLGETSCSFELTNHTKTSKPGQPTKTITIQIFEQDCAICAVHTLREYIKRPDTIRGNEEQLFISFVKPHKSVSRDTISAGPRQYCRTPVLILQCLPITAQEQKVPPKQSKKMCLLISS